LDPSKWATKECSFKIADAGTGPTPSPGDQPTLTSPTKPPEATEVFKSKTGLYEIRYDPAKWKVGSSTNPAAETVFSLISPSAGDTQVNVIFQPLKSKMQIATLKEGFLGNLKKAYSDVVVKEEKELSINNTTVTSILVNCKFDEIAGTVQAYLWTGDSGIIQVIAVGVQPIFAEFKDDIEKLLNGLVILNP
jgi:hypothetical protein